MAIPEIKTMSFDEYMSNDDVRPFDKAIACCAEDIKIKIDKQIMDDIVKDAIGPT